MHQPGDRVRTAVDAVESRPAGLPPEADADPHAFSVGGLKGLQPQAGDTTAGAGRAHRASHPHTVADPDGDSAGYRAHADAHGHQGTDHPAGADAHPHPHAPTEPDADRDTSSHQQPDAEAGAARARDTLPLPHSAAKAVGPPTWPGTCESANPATTGSW